MPTLGIIKKLATNRSPQSIWPHQVIVDGRVCNEDV